MSRLHRSHIFPQCPTCPFLQGKARRPGALQVALELVPGLGLEEPHAAHARGHLELHADEALGRGKWWASPVKNVRN